MTPRSLPTVDVHDSTTRIDPLPDSTEHHQDYFGNEVASFAIEALHEFLTVEVTSNVTISPIDVDEVCRSIRWRDLARQFESPVLSGLTDVAEYTYASPRISLDTTFADYANVSFNAHETLVAATTDLTQRIHKDFRYDCAATHVDTSVGQAFQLKAGVCQDFAQVQIACLRSIGLAARYVSGYLRTVPPPGQTKMVGADESHAWLSVYANSEIGWLDFDPTNGCMATRDHIPIAFGRDYLDVSPMRGVAIGGGTATLNVSVDVREVSP